MKKNKRQKLWISLIGSRGNFLKHNLYSVKHIYFDKSESKTYCYELISRKGTDSVASILYYEKDGEYFFGLKKQVRLAKALRKCEKNEVAFPLKDCLLLEAVAGSLEPNEKSPSKIKMRTKQEIFEEAGFDVKEKEIISLGKPFFSSPGQSTEKIYPFAVKVEPSKRVKFSGDGSLLEKESGNIKFYSFKKIFKMIKEGKIEDAKTEICLERLFLKLKLL